MKIVKPTASVATKAAALLKKGSVVIIPTDTVYGFLADALNKKAVEKIYKIKKRPKSEPLPVFVKDITMAKELAEINKDQEKILKKYWPGKYTFILKRKLKLKLYGLKKDSIAIRIPKYPFLNKILKKINRPLAQTSANISTQEPLKSGEQIIATFGKSKLVGLIVDSGSAHNAKPSKIIDLTKDRLTVLR